MSMGSYYNHVIRPWINLENGFFFFGWACLFILPISIAWIPFVLSFSHIQLGRVFAIQNRIHDLAVAVHTDAEAEKKATLEARTVRDKEVIMENMKRMADEINAISQRISFLAPMNPSATGPTFAKAPVQK